MEYIPDGLTKAQWEALKKKEEENVKNKNLGSVGITKFKSRAFEAWQKSGSSHLFPVDPNVPLEARPYMQRTGGVADGTDLLKKGLKPKEQAQPSAKNTADIKYEQLEKEDKLRSYPFSVPWTSEATAKIGKEKNATVKPATPTNSKTVSKQAAAKPEPAAAEPKKKGFLGLF
jgi:hypothetical protein